MRRMLVLFALGIPLVVCSLPSIIGAHPQPIEEPKTLYVPSAEYPTIQAAIDAANSGDTVLVGPDTYYEHSIYMKNGVILMSEMGPANTIIDAAWSGSAVVLENLDATTIIEGFTIRRGLGTGRGNGGAMMLAHSSPTIEDCIFARNSAEQGGAMYLASSSPTVRNCTYYGNSAGEGAGLYCYDASAPTLENTLIASSRQGDAIYSDDPESVPTLTCCDIFENVGGDWTDQIADQLGANGNISEDPLFCRPRSSDYRIKDISPCAAENSGCGLIGACDVGCRGTVVWEQLGNSHGRRGRLGLEAQEGLAAHSRNLEFCLEPAEPNPVRVGTRIAYAVPSGSPVTLSIYDVAGRLVRTLVDSDQPAGPYCATWDGTDQNGAPAATGVYFCRLTWNGKSETQRVVLLR